jgi:nitrile hydratase
MNGVHDLGGMHGFEFAERDNQEPVFKHEWEKHVFSARLAFRTPWPIDESRSANESMPPVEYLRVPYYARWLYSIEKLLVKYKLATEEELRNPDSPMQTVARKQPPGIAELLELFQTGISTRRDAGKAPRFRVGDDVVVKNEHPEGHTRMPRYVRGHRGSVYLDHGVFVFPDSNAKGEGEQPQHCYSVAFTAKELWGSAANTRDHIYVDLFDDYLEHVA